MPAKTTLMPVTLAQQQIMAYAKCHLPTEIVSLVSARGRVLGEPVISTINVPPADNSSMDGFALCVDDLELAVIPVSQRIAAGQVPYALAANTCARVFTGAEVPSNAELVVIQEEVELVEGGIRVLPEALKQGQKTGQFIRQAGQDVTSGQVVCDAGTKLESRHLGVLASIGIETVEVYRRLKVAVASTGSELVNPGQTLKPGQIYNSNRFLLAGLVDQMGMELIDLGIIQDQRSLTEAALVQASEQADVIITSGGVSEGEEDHVKGAVEALGQLNVWKLAIKPGKPLAFGHVNNTPLFGLPGNPASVLVTFMVMARPFLLASQGCNVTLGHSIKATLTNPPKRPSIRQEYLRVKVVNGHHNGQGSSLTVESMANQNSGVLSTAMTGDGLAVVKANTFGSQAQEVDFLPYVSYGV